MRRCYYMLTGSVRQDHLPYEQIIFTNEYFDTLGIECPDGTEPED